MADDSEFASRQATLAKVSSTASVDQSWVQEVKWTTNEMIERRLESLRRGSRHGEIMYTLQESFEPPSWMVIRPHAADASSSRAAPVGGLVSAKVCPLVQTKSSWPEGIQAHLASRSAPADQDLPATD